MLTGKCVYLPHGEKNKQGKPRLGDAHNSNGAPKKSECEGCQGERESAHFNAEWLEWMMGLPAGWSMPDAAGAGNLRRLSVCKRCKQVCRTAGRRRRSACADCGCAPESHTVR